MRGAFYTDVGEPAMIWAEHVKNRNEFPPEELARYHGKHVAWNLDGNRILGGNEDPSQPIADLKAAGYQPDDYVLSFVDRHL